MILDTAARGGLRMSSDALTPERSIAGVQVDYRKSSETERCETYRQVGEWLDGIGRSFPRASGCGATFASK